MKLLLSALSTFFLSMALHSQAPLAPMQPIPDSVTYAPANRSLPTIFVVGDSTSVGWGPQFVPLFDPAKVNVVVAGASGRSSRTYITEGLWNRVKLQMKPNDFVLLQFGHNDLTGINDKDRARGSIRSVGDETQEIDNLLTHKHEVVHTFGWYMRQMVEETKAKGATAIVMSMTPDNVWNGDKLEGDKIGYEGFASQVAAQEHVDFVDVTSIMTDRLTKLGQAKATELYATNDRTHFGKVGWQLVAIWTFEGLESLPGKPLDRFISARGREALPGPPK